MVQNSYNEKGNVYIATLRPLIGETAVDLKELLKLLANRDSSASVAVKLEDDALWRQFHERNDRRSEQSWEVGLAICARL